MIGSSSAVAELNGQPNRLPGLAIPGANVALFDVQSVGVAGGGVAWTTIVQRPLALIRPPGDHGPYTAMEREDRFNEIAALIDRSDRANFGDGVPSATIADAEWRLNKTFPPSYRWWLETFGAGFIGGYELMGLRPLPMEEREADMIISGDIIYQHHLNTSQALYPPHLIELLNYEGDEVYFFDASNVVANGEWPVVRLCPGDSDPTKVAADFVEFLRHELA